MKQFNLISNQDRQNAGLTGVFFISAAVTSIIGLLSYDPVLNHPEFLLQGFLYQNKIITGAIFELLLAVSATGTAIMLYPYLKRYNESLGLGYVLFRLLEVVFIIIGTVSILALLALSQSYNNASVAEKASIVPVGEMLQNIYHRTLILGPNFMLGINTSIYSYVFLKTELVPKSISIIGRIGGALVFIVAFLEMYGIVGQLSVWGMLMALPIFVYEMSLAIWLILRGFNLNKQF